MSTEQVDANVIPMHYVCTHKEAYKLIEEHEEFGISNCGCRESKGKCERSRMDVCLTFGFDPNFSSGSGLRKANKDDVYELLKEAEDKKLVARPFRDKNNKTIGICFCCDDCCGYFLYPEEKCDKGRFIEETNLEQCSNCNICCDVCYFGARTLSKSEELIIDRNNCHGCGLCADICPENCINMIERAN